MATGPACHWRTTSIRCAASCRNAPSRKRLALRLPPCAGPPAVHHATHAAQPQKREQTTRGRSRVRHPPPRDPRAPPARGEARSPSAPRSPLAPLASDREQSPRPAPPYTPPSPHSATTSTAGARRRRRVALSSLPQSPDRRSIPPARPPRCHVVVGRSLRVHPRAFLRHPGGAQAWRPAIPPQGEQPEFLLLCAAAAAATTSGRDDGAGARGGRDRWQRRPGAAGGAEGRRRQRRRQQQQAAPRAAQSGG